MRLYYSFLLLFFCWLPSFSQDYSVTELTTIHNESHAVLTHDGKRLYFTISNHKDNTGGKMDKGDIWY